MRINRSENEDTKMKAVLNKDSMLKASKWLVLALFGLVLLVLKVVWAFVWGVLQASAPNKGECHGDYNPGHWCSGKDGFIK